MRLFHLKLCIFFLVGKARSCVSLVVIAEFQVFCVCGLVGYFWSASLVTIKEFLEVEDGVRLKNEERQTLVSVH